MKPNRRLTHTGGKQLTSCPPSLLPLLVPLLVGLYLLTQVARLGRHLGLCSTKQESTVGDRGDKAGHWRLMGHGRRPFTYAVLRGPRSKAHDTTWF